MKPLTPERQIEILIKAWEYDGIRAAIDKYLGQEYITKQDYADFLEVVLEVGNCKEYGIRLYWELDTYARDILMEIAKDVIES